MGKGDQRSKKGKIFAGSTGKSRPKAQAIRNRKKAAKAKEAGK